ncbi:MAG TPA: DUF2252 domain-containing protein [Bryobacteraceae bacterium]|jgi:uncharacterized protein (DUF2252 family)
MSRHRTARVSKRKQNPINQNRARQQAGRKQRQRISRSKLGELRARKRGFNAIDVLLASTEGRVPKLLPLKYGRMSKSPFAFFRGAVSIMAADLANEPHTTILVQLCGDAHVQNLGCYEAPDGRLVFDINDFDETIPGPWEWDVKRMATSIVLAGLESDHRHSACAESVEAFAQSYCEAIRMLASQPILVAARHQIHRVRKAQALSAAWQQAERANPTDLLAKYTNGSGQFKKIDNSLWRIRGKGRRAILDSLDLYLRSLPPERLHLFEFFRPLDVAFKIVGTGSVGLRNYVVLMEGNGPKDPLFLQIKQEVESAYALYWKTSGYENQGQRVAEGQRRIQPVSDLLLGWTHIGEHDYAVRQLNDHKSSVDLTQLRSEGLSSVAQVAGELLARGHARSGDPAIIASYLGSGDKVANAIVHYALEYANVTQADFDAFTKAVKTGSVPVTGRF